jgi:hypothetical protein
MAAFAIARARQRETSGLSSRLPLPLSVEIESDCSLQANKRRKRRIGALSWLKPFYNDVVSSLKLTVAEATASALFYEDILLYHVRPIMVGFFCRHCSPVHYFPTRYVHLMKTWSR